MKNRLMSWGLSALFLTLVGAGCSDTIDEITNHVDCRQVCSRYSECFDADYDIDGCADKCENSADASETREAKLERCDACIDDKSCTGAAFNCADECAGIVP